MKEIIFKAEAGEVYVGDNIATENQLQELNGIGCQENFVEYSHIYEKLECGYMSFIFENGKLYTITAYSVKDPLTDEEIKELEEETQGQWSDGIGEGFEQFPCITIDGEEVFISPWYYGQTIETIIK